MNFQKTLFYLSIIVLFFSNCASDKGKYIPDVSHIKSDVTIKRFEQELFQLDTNNMVSEFEALKAEYPEFTNLFFSRVLPLKGETEAEFQENLRGYLTDSRILKLQDTVAIVFENIEREEIVDLKKAMKFMKYYFSDFDPPNVYTFTSEYTYQKFIFEDAKRDALGMGLDMFLGRNYDYKAIDPKNPAFSEYLTRTFSKEYIPKMMMEVLIDDRMGREPGSRLLDHMIHNGKKLYILDKVLPETPDSILFEYTAQQTEWVKSNELEMWAFFFDQNLFYESNSIKINKYINPSPSSPGMPDMAPGRTANYMGLQIVKAYMKKFPQTSLQQLMDLKDSQMIMDKSRYKPKQK